MKRLIFSIGILGSILVTAQQTKKDTASTKKIDEVTLTKKVFQKKTDRFVYDVAASPVAKGNTAFNLLKETPLVSSTDDKTLRIAGKSNAVIYINGRKTQMDADGLVAFLKNTPAENIQKIEVITMPGSEFQVESSDGIINIILKKRTDNGLNGNLRMANNQGYYNNPSAGVSINYRKNKLGISSSINTNDYTQRQYYILRNGNSTSNNQSEGGMSDPNKGIGGYLNIDYALTEKSNLALSYNTRYNKSFNSVSNLFNTLKVQDKNGDWQTGYNMTKNHENAQSYNNSVNLNYELKTDSLGSKLNLNAAYFNYHRGQNSTNTTLDADQYGNTYSTSKRIIQATPQMINNFSGMVDYIKKIKNDFTISVGGNYSNTKTDNDTKTTTYKRDPLTPTNYNITDTPNHFIYTENIYAVYVTFDKKFSDKFSGKVGARYEITNSLGTSDNAQTPEYKRIERNYNNLLPYLSLNYAINKDHNLSYSFSSRMRRPSFWELNPVKEYLTDFNYVQNNPFVKASSVYNQELTYMYKNSYFIIIGHKYIKDVLNQIPLQGYPVHPDGTVGTQNVLRYIRTNFGDKQELSAMFGIQKSFFNQYWTTSFNIGMQRNINNGTLSVDPTTGDSFQDAEKKPITYVNNIKSNSLLIQTNNTFRLDKAKTWYLGVNYFFVDKQQIELGQLKALSSLDVNIKKLWNDWTFALEVRDLLRTNKVVITDPQSNGNFNYVNQNGYQQQLELSITYNFGNKKVKKMRDIESANDAIKNRTR
ncbi:outer membrane beta-barrel family protein [Elizabethkingia anophelis]|uniref:outer membrane beta-barrel family protein n=1 Tax=Elizabethkingia anophelis TaxID=1117645 RepID=UPI002935482A|nr:TonB-dependent receptor [Elizabethkingia anophelis]MDV3471851.1 TonB-dependent receptor [Elizabethkingia anophelis]MDV3903810.1 TonB-dependent receptor [Elizabethkingia anophelis]